MSAKLNLIAASWVDVFLGRVSKLRFSQHHFKIVNFVLGLNTKILFLFLLLFPSHARAWESVVSGLILGTLTGQSSKSLQKSHQLPKDIFLTFQPWISEDEKRQTLRGIADKNFAETKCAGLGFEIRDLISIEASLRTGMGSNSISGNVVCLGPSPPTSRLMSCPSTQAKHNCFGSVSYSSDQEYIGEFQNGNLNGRGTLTNASGGKYVGEFKDGKLHGQGTYTYANGNKYAGEWRDNRHNGEGVEYRADGSVNRSGQWAEGNLVRSYALDTNRFPFNPSSRTAGVSAPQQSQVQTSLPPCPANGYMNNCFGTRNLANGAKYVGQFRNANYHGHGVFTFADGRQHHFSNWQDGLPGGEGIRYWSDGSVEESGRYEAGNLVSSYSIDPKQFPFNPPPGKSERERLSAEAMKRELAAYPIDCSRLTNDETRQICLGNPIKARGLIIIPSQPGTSIDSDEKTAKEIALRWGLRDDDLHTLKGSEVTHSTVINTVRSIYNQFQRGDSLFIYWSGNTSAREHRGPSECSLGLYGSYLSDEQAGLETFIDVRELVRIFSPLVQKSGSSLLVFDANIGNFVFPKVKDRVPCGGAATEGIPTLPKLLQEVIKKGNHVMFVGGGPDEDSLFTTPSGSVFSRALAECFRSMPSQSSVAKIAECTQNGLNLTLSRLSDKTARTTTVQHFGSIFIPRIDTAFDRLAAEVEAERKRREELEKKLAEAEAKERERQQAQAPQPQRPQLALRNERRLALVIGNSSYKISPLDNPVNDANDVAESLKKFGFQTTLVRNATLGQMREATRKFADQLPSADVALIYFAGHGIVSSNKNYMIPINADLKFDYELADQAYDAGLWLDMLDTIKSNNADRVNIVILDACRDNNLIGGRRSIGRGLGKMDAPSGTFLAYSTAPGKVAADGGRGERNSPFTKHLIRAMQQPNQPIEEVFKEVRRNVGKETNGAQVPWESTSLTGFFTFRQGR